MVIPFKYGKVIEPVFFINSERELLFQKETDLLSNKQLNFLRAMVDEVQQFSTADVIRKYNLGSSANVVRVRKALVDKEVIDIYGNTMEFIDPLFKQWMKRVYMR